MQVGFSSSSSLAARVIRSFTDSQFSHCFLVFDSADLGGKFVVEAATDGFHVRPFRYKADDKNRLVLVELRHEVADLVPYVCHWLGQPYDMAGAIGVGWVTIGRWLGQRWRNPFARERAMFCSEAIIRALQDLEYPGASELVAEDSSPEDLLLFLCR